MTEETQNQQEQADLSPEEQLDNNLDDAVVVENNDADLQEQILKLNSQISALKEQYIRERAENENLRKRQERELVNAHKYAVERLIKDLFPVLDSLSLGLTAARDAAAKSGENSESISKLSKGWK